MSDHWARGTAVAASLRVMRDATPSHHPSQEMLDCIQNCLDCHRACVQTVGYCLEVGGPHSEPAHIRLMLDCAEICQTSANFMMRGSDLQHATCAACAEICRACWEECRAMAGGDVRDKANGRAKTSRNNTGRGRTALRRAARGDNRMAACAELCRRCAESCEHMAGAVH